VDLAFAAVLAERQLVLGEKSNPVTPVTPEVLVPRLGDYLVDMGEISPSELDLALTYQKEQGEAGKPLLLGQVLLELGLIERETLDEAITMQILQLHQALRQSNRELEARVQERTQELERAVDKLTELKQLKANFIANISHELRTPLTHIRGYLDLLFDGELGLLNSDQSEVIAVVRRSESRLEKLIDDLIHFGMASRGDLSLNLFPVDISLMIQSIVEQLKERVEGRQLTIEACLAEGLPTVQCDEEKISWVIAQFIENAIKFSPEDSCIKIEAYRQDNFVTIAITDNGIGIPADNLEDIFEPFHQLDGSTTRRFGGTGLGLALSNRIIDAHNSQVDVFSEVGNGSRFEFSLPIVERVMES
jgi:signal transduction histidine kinase